MGDKFQNKYRIPSARLSTWDYSSNGAYFITMCTAKRQHYFGKIINEEMHLSNIGKKARECWLDIPNHFPFVLLDAFIVMPNHMHGIIIVDKPGNDFIVANYGAVVETGHALSLPSKTIRSAKQLQHPEQNGQRHPRFRNQEKIQYHQ